MKTKEERIREAIKNLDWFGDWFYCDIPDKEEYLKRAKAINDIKKLLKELREKV